MTLSTCEDARPENTRHESSECKAIRKVSSRTLPHGIDILINPRKALEMLKACFHVRETCELDGCGRDGLPADDDALPPYYPQSRSPHVVR